MKRRHCSSKIGFYDAQLPNFESRLHCTCTGAASPLPGSNSVCRLWQIPIFESLCIFFLFIFFFCNHLYSENKPVTVRVILKKLAEDAHIEVKGRHLICNPKTEQFLSSSSKKKKGKIYAHENGLYWNELLSGVHEIRIIPDEKNCSILVDGLQYKGWVEIYGIGGTINIINEVDTENYLKSILSSKINTTFSKETLDAIAITERTNLYHLVEKDGYASWQIEAEKSGYQGLNFNRAVHDAVDRTKDLILHYKQKPFAATWGMNHAGRSVGYPSIFRKQSLVPPSVDNLPSLHEREKTKWKTALPFQTIAKTTQLDAIGRIELFKAEKSQKVYAIRLFSPEGTKKDIPIADFQKLIGTNYLPSNDFSIYHKGKKAIFVGYGKGLGSGLCVTSSEILANRMASTENILMTHFPQSKLVNVRQENGKRASLSPAWN